jgi:hypothetical protein
MAGVSKVTVNWAMHSNFQYVRSYIPQYIQHPDPPYYFEGVN